MSAQVFDVRSSNGATLVRARGSLVFDRWRELRDAFDAARLGKHRHIVLNVHEVHTVDSFGVAAVLVQMDRAQSAGIKVSLQGCRAQVLDIFELTGVCRACTGGVRQCGQTARQQVRPTWN